MVKINFDKYDTSCKDNVWSWNIPNRNNTKNIKVVIKFEPGISFPTSTVEDMYFEEEDTDRHAMYVESEKMGDALLVLPRGSHALDYKKLYTELTEKILKYDHNSYGYIENFHEIHNDFKVGSDGFFTDEQLSEIQDSSEIYKIIRYAYKTAPKALTDFGSYTFDHPVLKNKEEK